MGVRAGRPPLEMHCLQPTHSRLSDLNPMYCLSGCAMFACLTEKCCLVPQRMGLQLISKALVRRNTADVQPQNGPKTRSWPPFIQLT